MLRSGRKNANKPNPNEGEVQGFKIHKTVGVDNMGKNENKIWKPSKTREKATIVKVGHKVALPTVALPTRSLTTR